VRYWKPPVTTAAGSKRNIVELMQVDESARDVNWLAEALQNAVELELATLPVYLSGLWSIEDPSDAQSKEAYTLIDSVIMEEMLHLGLVANMLKAIKGSPQFILHTYPGHLPGGVRPELCVYLAGLSHDSLGMYMQIEMPEHPVALLDAETFPTIGAFYDAILACFQSQNPPITISTAGQQQHPLSVPNPGGGQDISEPLTVLETLDDVEQKITLIKDQGEGTSTSPDAPEFGGELAHYYRFGEIYHGKRLKYVDGKWQYVGDPVPFPKCYTIPQVPEQGYPDLQPLMGTFDTQLSSLLNKLQQAWAAGASLNSAIGVMFQLANTAGEIVTKPLPGGGGNYGPDFKPA
jgi:hypothetical protein